jgi:hypothetical protein
MEAGDFFREIAALTGSRRTANVVAEEPTTFLEVPASAPPADGDPADQRSGLQQAE